MGAFGLATYGSGYQIIGGCPIGATKWTGRTRKEMSGMGLILLVLLLALLFFGLGFAAHLLWIAAVIFFIAWIAGFAFRRGEGTRWYRW